MNIGKQITKTMEQIKTRIRQKQADIKESEKCLIKYKEDKVTCAYNRMAIACWKEEINALREIYVTLKATEEIQIAFYDLNEKEIENNTHLYHENENYAYIDPKTESIKTWYKKSGITLHELKEYGENWYYYYNKKTKERRFVYQKKELYRDEYNSWEPIE